MEPRTPPSGEVAEMYGRTICELDEGIRPSTHADPLDIALTTNGHLLADLAQPL